MPEGARHTVAIAGAGIGAEHLDGYLALPAHYRVAAVCDLDEGRARALAARAEGCAALTDLDAVLADSLVDVVDVCLPPAVHYDVARRALTAGKHVVCEKPLAGSLEQADRLIEAARGAGRVLAPVFQYPYGRGFAQLQRLVEAGVAGRPLVASLETHWDRDAGYYAVPWRGTLAGELGGAVLGHAIHIHDLLCRIGGPVRRVSALLATRANDIEVEDCAALAFELAGGALATSSITLGAAGNVSRLRFCFDRLTAESGLDPYRPAGGQWRFTARDPADQARVDALVRGVEPGPESFAGFFAELARAFSDAARAERLAADGRRSIELVTAIYRAARDGRAVSLPLDARDPDHGGWSAPCIPGRDRV